jgi:hypothetical protein
MADNPETPRTASPTNSSASNYSKLSKHSDNPWKNKIKSLEQQIEDSKKYALEQEEQARLNKIGKQKLHNHNQQIAEQQTVLESTLSSPVNSQTQRSNSRALSHRPNRRAASPTTSSASNFSKYSDNPWKNKIKSLQQQIEDSKKYAQEQEEQARLNML